MRPFEFTDPRTLPFVEPGWRGELPHLYKEGCSYFVTFRLWDAVVLKDHSTNSTPVLQKPVWEDTGAPGVMSGSPTRLRTVDEIAEASNPPLRLGSCLLEKPEIAPVVAGALRHFDNQRYLLAAWCVMPNHVHAVFTPLLERSPSEILHSWKSFTSHKVNKLLRRQGPFWERESFDHLIRSVEDFERFIRYVEENPVAAGLVGRAEDWSSATRRNDG